MGEIQVIEEIAKTPELTATDIARICEKQGVTVNSVCKALADGLNANFPGKIDNNGQIVEASIQADMPTRHKYMTSALEVLRMVQKKDVVITNVNNNISGVDEEALTGLLHMVRDVSDQIRLLRTSGQQTGEVIDVGIE